MCCDDGRKIASMNCDNKGYNKKVISASLVDIGMELARFR